MDFGTLNYIVLAVYLAAMVAIGLRFAPSQKTTEDYFLAGRKMPWLVVGMSMFASLTSAVTYMGVPAMAYKDNVAVIFGVAVSPLVAPVLIFTFYPIYRRLNVTTSYEYILHRYGRAARASVSTLFVLARLGWLGTVIYAPALALSVATGLHLAVSILLMGVLATAYTALGGLAAVLWTDVAQFVVLTGGAVYISIKLAVTIPGGIPAIFENAQAAGRLDVFDFRFDLLKMTATAAAVSWFFTFMQDYGTDQVTVQRLLSVKKRAGVAKAIVFNSFNDLFINGMLLFIGLGLLFWYTQTDASLPETLQGDTMLPHYIMANLPAGLSGLLITAIFAAAMSSMDSGINSVTTVVMNDLVRPIVSGGFPEHKALVMSRWITIVLGVVATGVAFYAASIEHIVKAWSTFMSLFAGPILTIFVMGIVSRRTNFYHWLAASVISIPAVFYLQNATEIHWVYYFPISFLANILLTAGATLIAPASTKAPPELTLYKN